MTGDNLHPLIRVILEATVAVLPASRMEDDRELSDFVLAGRARRGELLGLRVLVVKALEPAVVNLAVLGGLERRLVLKPVAVQLVLVGLEVGQAVVLSPGLHIGAADRALGLRGCDRRSAASRSGLGLGLGLGLNGLKLRDGIVALVLEKDNVAIQFGNVAENRVILGRSQNHRVSALGDRTGDTQVVALAVAGSPSVAEPDLGLGGGGLGEDRGGVGSGRSRADSGDNGGAHS
jgi:hypothetical protein